MKEIWKLYERIEYLKDKVVLSQDEELELRNKEVIFNIKYHSYKEK